MHDKRQQKHIRKTEQISGTETDMIQLLKISNKELKIGRFNTLHTLMKEMATWKNR
jgi:hypothetical protein